MKWLKECYRNVLYTRITKSKALRLIKNRQLVYVWTFDNMGCVEERTTIGEIIDNFEGDVAYIEYLTHAYNGRIRFYLKEEKTK